MSDDKDAGSTGHKHWTWRTAKLLGTSESLVLVLIGIALVLVALLLLYSSMNDLYVAVHHGPGGIEQKAIEILNTVLLVMMTMEIVYTVAISLESDQPGFLYQSSERVYITAMGCEIEFSGTRELQAAGAGGL
jgi:formate hydrogenlyase subunit 4